MDVFVFLHATLCFALWHTTMLNDVLWQMVSMHVVAFMWNEIETMLLLTLADIASSASKTGFAIQ